MLTDRLDGTAVTVADPFSILLTDGRIYNSHNLKPVGRSPLGGFPRNRERPCGGPGARQRVDANSRVETARSSQVVADPAGRRALCAASGDDHSRGSRFADQRVELIDLPLDGAAVTGFVQGSQLWRGICFLDLKTHSPRAVSRMAGDGWSSGLCRCGRADHYVFQRDRSGQAGADAAGLSRLHRAGAGHPYRTFLHYNSWYDWGTSHV